MRTIVRNNYDPQVGDYHETIVIDDEGEKKYIFDCDGVITEMTGVEVVNEYGQSDKKAVSQKFFTDEMDDLSGDLADEIQNRTDADGAIWTEIENIEAASDVVDVVGTYAELQQYDTSKLHDNDLIKVLADETHDGEIAYYRWNDTTETFSYVGAEGPYYTQSQIDVMMSGKQDTLVAGTNIQIASDGKTISATDTTYTAGTGLDLTGTEFSVDTTAIQEKLTAGSNVQINNNVISATDTTYTHFTGATASADGVQGLVPGPLAGDQDKYLKADGTWTTITVPTYSDFTGATASTAGTHGFVLAPAAGDQEKFLKGDGTWGTVATTTIFYTDDITDGQTTELYSDSGYTTQITYGDLIDALTSGPVGIFYDNSVYYVVNYYVAVDPDWGTGYYIIQFRVQNAAYTGWVFSMLAAQRAANVSLLTSEDSYTLPTASASTAGIAKLYATTGQNTDGAVTQKLFTDTVGNIETALQILNSGAGVN